MSEYNYVISWLFIIEIIGLITFPVVSSVCKNLFDKGYSISKVLGILLLTFIIWMLSSLHIMQFGTNNAILSVVLIALISAAFILNNRIGLLELLKENKKVILKNELLFFGSFLIFLFILMKTPNIFYAYSEDFMDYAFIKSILRSEYMPPADPWYAGAAIPYYYGGHLIVAILTMLSGVPPYISYNLAGAVFFALTVSASYGVGYNLTKKSAYGLLTALFIAAAGFLSGLLQMLAFLYPDIGLFAGYQPVDAQNLLDWFSNYPFTGISWVIPNALTFYPAFVFLQGDLHSHTVAIPFQIAFILYIYGNMFRNTDLENKGWFNQVIESGILAIFLGFFLLLNLWNYPSYVIFTGLAMTFITFRKIKSKDVFYATFSDRISSVFYRLTGIVILSIILYSPYLLFSSSRGFYGLGLFGGKTELLDLLEIFGLFIFIISMFMLWVFPHDRIKIAVIIAMAFGAAWLFGLQTLIILIPFLAVSSTGMIQNMKMRSDESAFILLLVITGSILVLFCDIVYIRDIYGAPYQRMNTILKIYLEVWIFWGIAASSSLYFIMKKPPSYIKHRFKKSIWVTLTVLLILASLISPLGMAMTLTGSNGSLYGEHPDTGTLNGLEYLASESPYDMKAIEWIEKNITGSHVMVEAPGYAFTYSSRISALTGLPTIIGWTTHERVWRGVWSDTELRKDETDLIFSSEDNDKALKILEKYRAEYIYIGEIEKERYPQEGLKKFSDHPEHYKLVYENEQVNIYKVEITPSRGEVKEFDLLIPFKYPPFYPVHYSPE